MADDTKAPAPADSPQVAALKFKKASLEEKLKFIAKQDPVPGFDLDAARSRTENQIREIDAALKGAK